MSLYAEVDTGDIMMILKVLLKEGVFPTNEV
jgi:hypothetical protein